MISDGKSSTVDLQLKSAQISGADVNAARKSKTRCLHLASKNGDVAIIDLLVLYGAKLDCQNSEIQTPLHLACAKNKEQSAQHLIEK